MDILDRITPSWLYPSPIGNIEITPTRTGWFAMKHNKLIRGIADNPNKLAYNVYWQVTGYDPWDTHLLSAEDESLLPENLWQWENISDGLQNSF